MNGSSVIVDTNVAVDVLNGVEATVATLSSYRTLCLPIPVLGELLFGALNSA